MSDYEFIMKFSKIKLSDICKKLNINRMNLYNNVTSKKNLKLVRNEIEKEYLKLFMDSEHNE